MANEETDILENRITAAENELNKTLFGDDISSEGESAYRFLDRKELGLLYSNELGINTISKNLTGMQQSIRRMSSSYLPVSFFLNDTFNSLSAVIEESVSESESYENAFMRMLGMPQSDEFDFAELLVTVDSSGTVKSDTSYEEVLEVILNERQKARPDRDIVIDDEIYDTTGGVSIDKLSDFFFNFSYLLLPPIQDSRISRCINEADKIVAEPFSNQAARVVNRKKIRSSLLETIIRIRLDRLSGTNDVSGAISIEEESTASNATASLSIGGGGTDEEKVNETPDSFGILETLFILRLRSALSGVARDIKKKINNMLTQQQKTGLRPGDPGKSNNMKNTNSNVGAASKQKEFEQAVDARNKVKLNSLENQRLVEDSIMALLGDNTEVLDLQSQTQRNSTIRDAHLMDGLISIIDLPRKRIESDIAKLNRKTKNVHTGITDPIRSDIDAAIGVDIGIGTIDMIVFSLALFTMSEEGLVGLLSDKQFENLKNEKNTSELIPGTGDKMPTLDALKELSDLVIAGYKTFLNEVAKSSK